MFSKFLVPLYVGWGIAFPLSIAQSYSKRKKTRGRSHVQSLTETWHVLPSNFNCQFHDLFLGHTHLAEFHSNPPPKTPSWWWFSHSPPSSPNFSRIPSSGQLRVQNLITCHCIDCCICNLQSCLSCCKLWNTGKDLLAVNQGAAWLYFLP